MWEANGERRQHSEKEEEELKGSKRESGGSIQKGRGRTEGKFKGSRRKAKGIEINRKRDGERRNKSKNAGTDNV